MRIKRNRKLMSILLTLSLLVTLLVPMVGPAAAASTYTMSNVKTVTMNADGSATRAVTGTMTVDIPSLTVSGYCYLSLPSSPSGFIINNLSFSVPANVGGDANSVSVVNATEINTHLYKIDVTVNGAAVGNEGKFVIGSGAALNGALTSGLDITFPNGSSGDIKASISSPSSQVFSGADVVVAKIGTGTVSLSLESVQSIGSGGGQVGIIQVKEGTDRALAGAAGSTTDSLVFTLPPGFTWNDGATFDTLYWGNTTGLTLVRANSNRDLKIVNDGTHTSGSYFTVKAAVTVDETVAKTGDVDVTIGGDSTASPGDLIVAHYGDYSSTVSAVSKLDVVAGQADQKLGEIAIQESLPGSLEVNRTISLNLPSGARWTNYPVLDADASQNNGNIAWGSNWAPVGTDGRMIKRTVLTNTGTDPAKLVFKDAKVALSADCAAGDLTVNVSGTAGASGDVAIGNVVAPVTITASATPDVIIGLANQAAGDLTITETKAGNILSTANKLTVNTDTGFVTKTTDVGADLLVVAPSGVTFTSDPKVEVTDGDLVLDTSGISTSDQTLTIPIKSYSTKAATIKVSGVLLTIDRTVPEGGLTFKVKGSAVNDDANSSTHVFTATTVASTDGAKVVTPAPNQTKATAVFKIGDTSFTLNGVAQTMDAAPYLKNDRTYLPLRFVAKAVGVSDSNIIWNGDEQSVTLIKDGSVVKMTIGSTTMTINGTPITMDVAPEIVDPGRTMLPVRWVGQALGANIQWDAATQTVTVN